MEQVGEKKGRREGVEDGLAGMRRLRRVECTDRSDDVGNSATRLGSFGPLSRLLLPGLLPAAVTGPMPFPPSP